MRGVAARVAGALGVSLGLWLGFASAPGRARAELPVEKVGRVETLPQPMGVHWIWVEDALLARSALVDADSGRMLGQLSSGWGIPLVLAGRGRPEVYTVETHYSRRTHGERTDVLTIHDPARLAPVAEVVLPNGRALSALTEALAAVSDDGTLAAIFNLTPATSLSLVDLVHRRFAGEVATPGCSLVYPAGPRRFASLCMDGALLVLDFDAAGAEQSRFRSEPFFDPRADPVMEKAARWGDRWLFVSFAGVVHPVDLSGPAPVFEDTWSLVDDADRAESWRVGGAQPLAVHADSGRLFALMHQGGSGSHKDGATEVWVFDLEQRRRVQRIELHNPGFTYMGVPLQAKGVLGWILDKVSDWMMGSVPELGIDSVVVTPDAEPRLVTAGAFSGGLGVYDALSGAFLGRGFSGNLTNIGLVPAVAAGTGR